MRLGSILAATSTVLLGSTAHGFEGQWPPDQIPDGLAQHFEDETSREDLQGLLIPAVVNYGGCSGAFISPDGLFVTNHHCAYGAIQSASSNEANHLINGFAANSRGEELPVKGRSLSVWLSTKDVTAQVHGAIKGIAEPAERAIAADLAQRKLVADCEAKPGRRCNVGSFNYGSYYRLFEFQEYDDLRLVFAPPAAVGEYGGDIDNWQWPRHSGDFTVLRAYGAKDRLPRGFNENNAPLATPSYLRVAQTPIGPGDKVLLMGYPGHTDRYLPHKEVLRRLTDVFPTTIGIYSQIIEYLEAQAKARPEVALKLAPLRKSLANRNKNARGMVAGLKRMKFEDVTLEEKKMIEAQPGGSEVVAKLSAIVQLRSEIFKQRLVLATLQRTLGPLATGIDLERRRRAQSVPDIERPRRYMERNASRLEKNLQRRLRNYDETVEVGLMRQASLWPEAILDADALKPLRSLSKYKRPELLLRKSWLTDQEAIMARFRGPDLLEGDKDPLFALARQIADAVEEDEKNRRKVDGLEMEVYPKFIEMLAQVRGVTPYPNANGTIRVSVAEIRSYVKPDGKDSGTFTTIGGAIKKHTGQDPFDYPAAYRTASRTTPHADPRLKDVPACFLSDADTTGGNSGSPVVNIRGELVGLNFDRVWENIAGDFAYRPVHSRNITVDARYLMWSASLSTATPMLSEIEAASLAPPRASPERVGSGGRCSCRDTRRSGGESALPMILLLLLAIAKSYRFRSEIELKPHRGDDV